ncbi:MAG: hypothetical protein EOO61_00225 [Hymenobacter sp.]|nr:MAG: hypothetical protein EOO61_00225 [Hymenobacter sp.]
MPAAERHFNFDVYGAQPDNGKSELPVWLDYIEMVCLLNKDNTMTRGQVYDLVFNEAPEITPQTDDELPPEDGQPLSVQVASDTNNQTVLSWFSALKSKSEEFGEAYPFIVNSSVGEIKLKNDLSDENKFYIYLLMSASLKVFSNKLRNKITTDFEFVCFEAQERIFPLSKLGVNAETHFFGKNPEAKTGRFVGKLEDKFQALAQLINCHNLDISPLKSNNTGDRGIDVLSVFRFERDRAFGLPLIIAQCACSYEDWTTKQYDHHKEKYYHYRLFPYDYIRITFIPFYYRDVVGQWFKPDDISTVVIDRLRLIRIMEESSYQVSKRALDLAELALMRNDADKQEFARSIISNRAA